MAALLQYGQWCYCGMVDPTGAVQAGDEATARAMEEAMPHRGGHRVGRVLTLERHKLAFWRRMNQVTSETPVYSIIRAMYVEERKREEEKERRREREKKR